MILLLTGGRVIDPVSQTDRIADVAIENGVIRAIESDLAARSEYAEADRIDVGGQLVVPGLIDLHAHVFPGALSLDPAAEISVRTDLVSIEYRRFLRDLAKAADDPDAFGALLGWGVADAPGNVTVADAMAAR